MRDITVLFTAVCGWPTHATCNALRAGKFANYTIVGVDCAPFDAAKNYVDYLYKVPRCQDEGYCDKLLGICLSHKVDIVIPLISEEITILRKNSAMFEEKGIRFPWTGSDGLFDVANDKLLLKEYLEARGMDVFPKTLPVRLETLADDLAALGYPDKPVVLKLRDGCGAMGFRVIDAKKETSAEKSCSRGNRSMKYANPEQAKAIISETPSRFIIQEYMPGTEAGTMCLADHGETVYSLTHENYCMQFGTATDCMLIDCEEANEIAAEANKLLMLNGNIGFDFKRDADGRLKLLEINPRISATVSLAVKAGLNIVEYGVLQGLDLPFPRDTRPLYGLRMQRVYGTLYSFGGEAYGT